MDNLNNLIFPKFLDAALTPVAKEAGDRLADVVSLIFTPIILARKYRDAKLNSFLEELDKRLKSIPTNNIVNPPLSIVGPTLDCVAKFYYEEKHLRQLFAQLIAASMNKAISPEVHPAFIEIIKQLDLNDAIILNSDYLAQAEDDRENSSVVCKCIRPICDVVYRSKITGVIFQYIAKNLVFVSHYFSEMDKKQFAFSLQNLIRLNIISIDENTFNPDSFYQQYLQPSLVEHYTLFLEGEALYNPQNTEVSLIKKEISLTDFGLSFIKTCVR